MTREEVLVHSLVDQGVSTWVVCAGSRNARLIAAVHSASPKPQVFSLLDEREASFFALGLSRIQNKTVAVLVTSGTAVAECLPAVIEAHYSGARLLIVSADRPKNYRGTGAPQSIEQKAMFGQYVRLAFDLGEQETFSNYDLLAAGPVHINVCLGDEPVQMSESRSETLKKVVVQCGDASLASKEIEQFLFSLKKPLVIVGQVPASARSAVASALLKMKAPCWIESCSGLRGHAGVEHLRFKVADRFWSQNDFDGVLRIGSVPTLRLWRDLAARNLKVLSLDPLGFSGSPGARVIVADVQKTLDKLQPIAQEFESLKWLPVANALESKILELLATYPKSEPTWVHRLSRAVPQKSHLYLGNSLPIREWDLFARANVDFEVSASRGANGIDGQIATYLGLATGCGHSIALIGDQTFRYDAKALLLARDQIFQARKVDVIVINNGGGQIFSRLPSLRALPPAVLSESIVQTNIESLKNYAEAFGTTYECWTDLPQEFFSADLGARVVEIVPSAQQSSAFWERFEKLA